MGKFTDFNFGRYINSLQANETSLKILEKRMHGRIQGLSKIFRAAIYGAHRAVVFAIAHFLVLN